MQSPESEPHHADRLESRNLATLYAFHQAILPVLFTRFADVVDRYRDGLADHRRKSIREMTTLYSSVLSTNSAGSEIDEVVPGDPILVGSTMNASFVFRIF